MNSRAGTNVPMRRGDFMRHRSELDFTPGRSPKNTKRIIKNIKKISENMNRKAIITALLALTTTAGKAQKE